jgi:hypothetical protein
MIFYLDDVAILQVFFGRSLLNISNVMPGYEATYFNGMRFSNSGRELMTCWYLAGGAAYYSKGFFAVSDCSWLQTGEICLKI